MNTIDFARVVTLIGASFLMGGCGSSDTPAPASSTSAASEASLENSQGTSTGNTSNLAQITGVSFTGDSGAYNFNVTIRSPDTGCEQYADWWEVFKPDGTLIYRRILTHSHVNEQPFTRSGGPVTVLANEEVVVRAHMINSGYGQQVFRGSVEQGLALSTLERSVAADLATVEPLPTDCAF